MDMGKMNVAIEMELKVESPEMEKEDKPGKIGILYKTYTSNSLQPPLLRQYTPLLDLTAHR